MPLSEARMFITTYGANLRQGPTIEKSLIDLLDHSFGNPRIRYNRNLPVLDSNYDAKQAIFVFVHLLGAEGLNETRLHQLNQEIIQLRPKAFTEEQPNVAQALLAYEMQYFPTQAEQHFASESFLEPQALLRFKIKLRPIMREFRLIAKYPDKARSEGEIELILEDLHQKITPENTAVDEAIAQLISAIHQLPKEMLSTRGEDIATMLSKALALVDNELSLHEYQQQNLHWIENMTIPPSAANMAKGSILCVAAGLIFTQLPSVFAAPPASYLLKTGTSLFEPERHPTWIPKAVYHLGIQVENARTKNNAIPANTAAAVNPPVKILTQFSALFAEADEDEAEEFTSIMFTDLLHH